MAEGVKQEGGRLPAAFRKKNMYVRSGLVCVCVCVCAFLAAVGCGVLFLVWGVHVQGVCCGLRGRVSEQNAPER